MQSSEKYLNWKSTMLLWGGGTSSCWDFSYRQKGPQQDCLWCFILFVFPFHVLFSWSRVGWDSSLYVPNSWVYLQIIYRWPTNRTQTKYSQYLPVYSMSIPLFRAIPGASFGASLFLGCLKRVPSTTHHWALQWAPCCLAILASLRKQFTGACSKELPLLNAVSLGRRRNHLGTFG